MQTAREVMAEMEGKPMPEVAERLANLMEEQGIDVPMLVHLGALGSALLNVQRMMARDLGALLKANGLNVDPDEYATRLYQLTLLSAQADVYEAMMPKPGLRLVEAEVVDDNQLVIEWTPEAE